MYEEIAASAKAAITELIEVSGLKSGDVCVIGCSSSEVGGRKIGSDSNLQIAESIFSAIYPELKSRGIYLAAQCCEHLNRAIIIESALAEKKNLDPVNVVPQPKAGGSFATTAYANFESPVAVEEIRADAGLDIGATLIGMHLKKVAVPVRLKVKKIGEAPITCARTRPKFIGGERAHYNDLLK